ncbi:uncharacterized protein LOC143034517 isoform X1 [Oratosquilla oratoria]|uniref:uncharacterized protein LOC143034517 isoform X1 n=1 Tax=Oratosquilla oratoria TaxID=337810 RepID=UPI003F762E58
MDKLWQATALMTMMVLMLGVGPSAQDQSPSTTQANTDCLDGIPGFDIFLFKFCEEVCPWTTMESSCPPDTITPSHTPTTTSVPCPACDESISVDNSVKGTVQRKWSSPNYPKDYPEGCNCTLSVKLPAVESFLVSFENGSEIYDASGCHHDRLVITGDLVWTVCGSRMDMSSKGWYKMSNKTYFTATFISDSGDGNKVATGFEMILDVLVS